MTMISERVLRTLRERTPGMVLAGPQQIQGHGWNDGSREKIRGQHGKDNGFGKWHKEKFRDASEKEHGQEHDADA